STQPPCSSRKRRSTSSSPAPWMTGSTMEISRLWSGFLDMRDKKRRPEGHPLLRCNMEAADGRYHCRNRRASAFTAPRSPLPRPPPAGLFRLCYERDMSWKLPVAAVQMRSIGDLGTNLGVVRELVA